MWRGKSFVFFVYDAQGEREVLNFLSVNMKFFIYIST